MGYTELASLTDDELERLAEAISIEQVERQKAALKAVREGAIQVSFLPPRLYAGVR